MPVSSESSPLKSAAVNSSTVDEPTETSPLLTRTDTASDRGSTVSGEDRDGASSLTSRASRTTLTHTIHGKKSRRWPSIIAILILGLASIAIIVGVFFVPAALEEYSKEATVIEPTNLSLQSITAKGVHARVQGNIRVDASRVKNVHVRRLGRTLAWIFRRLGSDGKATFRCYLPEYDNMLLGTAEVPPMVLTVVDNYNNAVDFVAELVPGDAEVVRVIANDWLKGRLARLRLTGTGDVNLKTWFVPLGTVTLSDSMVFEARGIPELPEYNITKMNFEDIASPGEGESAMAAEVSLSAYNKYPIQVDIPKLGFEVLIPNCDSVDPYILIADATTSEVAIRPRSDVVAEVHGVIRELSESLLKACPDSESSPLDILLKEYLSGGDATVFVRGKRGSSLDAPDWVGEILSSVTLPVPFPGRTFDNLIEDFSLSDVHFSLPDPLAEPGDANSTPQVSGTIVVTAGLPAEMNFEVNVTNVRANADVFFHKQKLGELNLRKWQPANSTREAATENHHATLKIQSRIADAPLDVTDGNVMSDVIQALLFGDTKVLLGVEALVDVKFDTILGQLVLKDVPAEGKIPVKPMGRRFLGGLSPSIGNVRILDTTHNSISLEALVNVTNPTSYTAYIPFISIHIISNGSVLGEATARSLNITAGNNTNQAVRAVWNPAMGGPDGSRIGRGLLSEYLSGRNTTISLKTHKGSIPMQPLLGEALSRLNLTVAAPRLGLPGGAGEDSSHFIRDAIFHLVSSTATFMLASPMEYNTIYLERINATAFYNHTEPVAVIKHGLPLAVPPGISQTPRLPVEWSLDSVGRDKLKEALGGTLKLDAKAEVTVRVGNWQEMIWFEGAGIGAKIRL